ncbi:hypothetical protein V6N13_110648 [Hibiscus sabdariffa]|uniref:Pentatricopeptide repeat-containing protein n=1 Tax=Hibiscus sabdariffa TaxID=183260 RepID=A0ABR2THV5_9ROSI
MQVHSLVIKLEVEMDVYVATSLFGMQVHSLKQGKEIHGLAIRRGISNEEFMATAFIDMYMNCGYSSCAHKIFNQFEYKPDDPAFWNAMISGYGRNGENEAAFEMISGLNRFKVTKNENGGCCNF